VCSQRNNARIRASYSMHALRHHCCVLMLSLAARMNLTKLLGRSGAAVSDTFATDLRALVDDPLSLRFDVTNQKVREAA
jgi:hypothetical protein